MAFRNGVTAAVGAVLTAALLTTVPALGATAFTISGTKIFEDPPYPEQLVPELFAGDKVEHIEYPASVFGMDAGLKIAAAALAERVDNTEGEIIVAGFSQGAIAIVYEKRRLMKLDEDERPAADQLTFVTIGDPTGDGGILRWIPFRIPIIGLTPVRPPDTPYDTTIINGEYDGWADFPDRPWNLISTANALLGIIYVHGRYEDVPGGIDLSEVPDRNIFVSAPNSQGGVTTTYIVPTKNLPLLQPLRDLGFPEAFVAALEEPLRKIVDAGYRRNDPLPVSETITDTEDLAPVETEGTVEPADETDATTGNTAISSTTRAAAKTATARSVSETAVTAEAGTEIETVKENGTVTDVDNDAGIGALPAQTTVSTPTEVKQEAVTETTQEVADETKQETEANVAQPTPKVKKPKSDRPRLNLFKLRPPRTIGKKERSTVPKAEASTPTGRDTDDNTSKPADTASEKAAA